jgi:hypothetical protein
LPRHNLPPPSDAEGDRTGTVTQLGIDHIAGALQVVPVMPGSRLTGPHRKLQVAGGLPDFKHCSGCKPSPAGSTPYRLRNQQFNIRNKTQFKPQTKSSGTSWA